ncbi:MAG: hypothetical protein HY895_21335 [Deltaproteobacteria bacterium]|nr:hypothetical protein [Deltaproteobacteria bacterium]
METIAVYFEPVAKSYGLHTVRGVVMVRTSLTLDLSANSWPGSSPAPQAGKFSFVMLQCEPDGSATLYTVAPPEDIHTVLQSFGWRKAADAGQAELGLQPVEIVLFQGPHFYERYGIAAAALDKLREKKAELLLAGFSGSMAYIVVPDGTAEVAKAALTECFHLP